MSVYSAGTAQPSKNSAVSQQLVTCMCKLCWQGLAAAASSNSCCCWQAFKPHLGLSPDTIMQ